MPLADTLLRLAGGPRLFLPKWTDEIMAEVGRTLQRRFGVSPERTAHRESQIRQHFPEAWVGGYETLTPAMTNEPDDRHVLAAAVCSGAEVIVTYNLRHFPPAALDAYSITAQGPSAFLKNLYALDPEAVLSVLHEQAAAISQPFEYLLQRLRVSVPAFADVIETHTRPTPSTAPRKRKT
jgi:hypothetical protein